MHFKKTIIALTLSLTTLFSSCKAAIVNRGGETNTKTESMTISASTEISFVGEYIDLYADKNTILEASENGIISGSKVTSNSIGDVTITAKNENGVAELTLRFIGKMEFITDLSAFSLHSEKYGSYLAGKYDKINDYGDGNDDFSKPNKAVVSWADVNCDRYTVRIADSEKFDSYHEKKECKTVNTTSCSVSFDNLMLFKDYYVRVEGYKNDSLFYSGELSFRSIDGEVRPIAVDGTVNFRDLGGYLLSNGKRIRQGMLYRSGRFGYADENGIVCEVTDTGKAQLDDLGIVSEVDLRGGSDGKTNEMGTQNVAAAGGFGITGMRYYRYPMGYGNTDSSLLASPVNKAAIKDIFDLLSCENSYPLVFHCNIGTDRTGAVSFIVLSLLGASKEDIFKDYCLSQLAPIGKSVNIDAISGYFKFIDDYYCGKCENYLLDIGITEKQIESIRELLTETK